LFLLFFHFLTPLILGVFVYLFFRSNIVPVSEFFAFLNPNKTYYDSSFISNLPDFLSIYAVNSLLIILLNRLYVYWHSVFLFLFVLFIEILQHIFPWGTFDFIDIILYLLGVLSSMFFLRGNTFMK
jgi:hypothetical protein